MNAFQKFIDENSTLIINDSNDFEDSNKNNAFYVIINGVDEIPNEAFSNCKTITQVNIGNEVTKIGNKAFYFCSDLSVVNFGVNIKTIGESAFSSTNLNNITIPNSVDTIGYRVLYDCNQLLSVTIGANVQMIGNEQVSSEARTSLGSEQVYKAPIQLKWRARV